MSDYKGIGLKLEELRKQKSLSQCDVASRAQISYRTYQRIENGEMIPRVDALQAVLKALGAEPSKFYIDLFFEHQDCPCLIDQNHVRDVTSQNKKPANSGPILASEIEIEGIKRSLSDDFNKGLAKMGYWEWNTVTNDWYWSDQMYVIYDLDPFDPNFHQNFAARILPEDYEQIHQALDALIKKNQLYCNTHRVNSRSGRIVIRATAKKHFDQYGNTIVFGIAERMSG